VTVKCLGFDGTRLNPRKADLQAWREGFADKLRDQGIDADATPRRARGVVRKPESNVIRHIERGDSSHKPRVSKVRAAKIKEAAQELTAEAKGLPVAGKPWEQAIKARQRDVRRAWLAVADALEQADTRPRTGDFRAHGGAERLDGHQSLADENKALASRIRDFVGAMPTIDTERHQIKRDLAQRFSRQAENIHDTNPQLAAPGPGAGQKNSVVEVVPKQGSKDTER